jgi:hypothetical protein
VTRSDAGTQPVGPSARSDVMVQSLQRKGRRICGAVTQCRGGWEQDAVDGWGDPDREKAQWTCQASEADADPFGGRSTFRGPGSFRRFGQ